MKIAIPAENGQVCAHFGRAPGFAIVSVNGKTIEEMAVFENPGMAHGSLPGWLKGQGVEAVLAGGMGEHPRRSLAAEGVTVCLGVSGGLEAAVRAYLEGTLESGESLCGYDHDHGRSHGDGSGCGHGGCSCGAGRP